MAFLRRLEAYCLDVITYRKKGVLAFFVRGLLWILSFGYRLGVWTRNWAFDRGWMPKYYPPVPVTISIGNIVAGGTGKTPVTAMLIKPFYERFRIALLSRGYRSPSEFLSSPVALSRGEGPLYPAAYCGDEAYLLSSNFPKTFFYVGRDRRRSSMMAARAGVQMIFLDDGMQYRYLARDFEVVVVDGQDPLGQGYYLPRGFLRDNLSQLSRADLIVINNIQDRAHYLSVKHQLVRYSKAPTLGVQPTVMSVQNLHNQSVPSLKGKKVGIFCGIARPEHFQRMVRGLEAHVVGELFSPDHLLPEQEAFRSFALKCKEAGAEYLVCTEKDRVKWPESFPSPLPVLWVKMQLSVVEGEAEWLAFIDTIRRKVLKDVSQF